MRALVTHVVGARPNFPKLSPVYHALRERGVRQRVIHTGQHYSELLSDDFFKLLGLPDPDTNLEVGSGTHAAQTARILERIEPVLVADHPSWLVVYGDVNSTMAAAIAASKVGVRVAHVEAGLRSFDRAMPEEINRVVTDRLADLLLTPSREASDQLRREGEPEGEIRFVGNVMIDTLMRILPNATSDGGSTDRILVTLHRPSNVDDPTRLRRIVDALRKVARKRPVLFAAHPRTANAIAQENLALGDVTMTPPLPYLRMLGIMNSCHAVVTDSGGIQEETTVLGIPCLTMRENTERPITVSEGTNRLVFEPDDIPAAVEAAKRPAKAPAIEGWDGKAGQRIAQALLEEM